MKIILTSLFLFTTALAQAAFTSNTSPKDTGRLTISGSVMDPASAPMPFASVMLLNSADSMLVKGTLTDSTGHFIMENIQPGNYIIAASQSGSKVYSDVFRADRSHILPPLRFLQTGKQLSAVEIKSRKPYIEMMADKMVLNVENSIIATGNTLFEVLRRAPGIRTDQQEQLILMGSPGVAVWIDGRPSNLTGESLTVWLKSQPADVVSTIEIITNPSSRYDAAGASGIINIRLKKNLQQGLNGNVFLGGGMGKYPKGSSGLNVNFRRGKINLYGNYNYYYSESYNRLTFNSVHQDGGRLNRENYWHPVTNAHYAKIGADYFPDSKTTIGFIANFTKGATGSRTDARTIDADPHKPQPSLLNAATDRTENSGSYRFNLNLQRNTDTLGSTLQLDADVAVYNRSAVEGIINDRDGMRIAQLRNMAPSNVFITSFKADYSRYFTKSFKMETGAKASYVQTDNNFRYDSLLQEIWTADKFRSNHFRYTEQVQATYVSFSYDRKKWSFQAGLRAERTAAQGQSVTLDSLVKNNYINLFPTIYVVRKIAESQQLTFSYGKRISRPGYQTLNPFVQAIDPYTFMEGNPYLKPQFNHTFRLMHNFRDWLYTTAYYSYMQHYSGTVLRSDPVTRVIRNKTENLGHGVYTYLSLTAVIPVGKWLETETNAGVGYAGYTSVLPGNTFHNSGTGAEFSTTLTFLLPHQFRLQVSADYATAAPNGQYQNKAAYGTDLGIQKSFRKNKGSIRLNVSDPFNTRAFRANIYTGNTAVQWENRWENRRVNLQFSWKFGNQQIKSVRTRNTGSKEEENRVEL